MGARTLVLTALLCYFSASEANAGIFLTLDELDRSTTFAQDPRFSSVGFVSWTDGQSLTKEGSGVLVAPNWVLTAAHVADDFLTLQSGQFGFGLGYDGSNSIAYSQVTEVILHPSWSGSAVFGGDIALMRLGSALSGPLATLYRGVEPGFSTFRPVAHMSGFGQYGVVDGTLETDLLMRAGSNIVRSSTGGIGDDQWTTDLGFASDRIDMEWKGAPGDSGGGWFIDVNGQWQLGAISVSVTLPYNGPGLSNGTSISRYASWIDSHITAVPEPNTFLMAGLASLILFSTRRRTKGCRRSPRSAVLTYAESTARAR